MRATVVLLVALLGPVGTPAGTRVVEADLDATVI
jgi:hypothetical protein